MLSKIQEILRRTPAGAPVTMMRQQMEELEGLAIEWDIRHHASLERANRNNSRADGLYKQLGKAKKKLKAIDDFSDSFEAVPTGIQEQTTEEAYDLGFARGYNSALAELKKELIKR